MVLSQRLQFHPSPDTEGKPVIHGSADPAFRGDRSRWDPEELLLASLSACHKLWYLHLAAEAGIIVTAYADRPEGVIGRDPYRSPRQTGAPAQAIAHR